MGRPLAGEYTRAETASEFTSKLIHSIKEVDGRFTGTGNSKSIKENAQQFTTLYLLSLFSNHIVDKKDAGIAFILWRRLRLQLWMAKLYHSFARLRSRIARLTTERA